MSTATDELHAALRATRNLPGWTVNRLDTGAYRVTSPTGMGLVPAAPTQAACADALAMLDTLGLQHDTHHRLLPPPPAPAQPELTVIPDPEKDTTAVPTTATTNGITLFEYPRKPQEIALDQLLPAAFKRRKTRLMIPRVVIDAEIAEAFFELRANEKNRKLRLSNKKKFVRLIKDGQFDHTHQGFSFNTDGFCADGQHRLAALLEVAEDDPTATIVVDITYNAPVESARAYDGGANRHNADRLQVAGFENPKVLAQLVRLLYLYEEGIDGEEAKRKADVRNPFVSWKEISPISEVTLIDWAERYGEDLLECLAKVRPLLRRSDMHLNIAAVGRYLAREQWPESPIDTFVEAVGEDTLRPKDSPQRALTNWLYGNKRVNKNVSQQTIMAMFLLAYKDYCVGKDRNQMKWVPAMGMPIAYAPRSTGDDEQE